MQDLLKLLASISYLWVDIGQVLGVPYKDLECHYHSNFPDPNVKLSLVIKQWITHHTTEVTWNTIIAAMKSEIIGQIKIGENIRRHVLNINQKDLSHHESDITNTQSKKQTEVLLHEERSYNLCIELHCIQYFIYVA